MAKTYHDLDLSEQWIVFRSGDVVRDCYFSDCVLVLGRGKGEVRIETTQFDHCTFVGRWPPIILHAQKDPPVIPSSEPEVMEAIFRPFVPGLKKLADKSDRRRLLNLFRWRK